MTLPKAEANGEAEAEAEVEAEKPTMKKRAMIPNSVLMTMKRAMIPNKVLMTMKKRAMIPKEVLIMWALLSRTKLLIITIMQSPPKIPMLAVFSSLLKIQRRAFSECANVRL